VFESIRLCGPVTGPARVVCENYTLPSERTLKVPKKQVVTLSSYYTHRQADVWGQDAARYVPDRFAKEDPPIGSERYITWGLQTPHLCPGLWFGLQVIEILVFRLFATYSIVPDKIVADTEKYKYSAGNVVWKDVGVTVKRN
jgi:cytochrome P450